MFSKFLKLSNTMDFEKLNYELNKTFSHRCKIEINKEVPFTKEPLDNMFCGTEVKITGIKEFKDFEYLYYNPNLDDENLDKWIITVYLCCILELYRYSYKVLNDDYWKKSSNILLTRIMRYIKREDIMIHLIPENFKTLF